ncbi:MAG: PfkB family carbohydrate kinase, partial [Vicinamibacterales bacterium]
MAARSPKSRLLALVDEFAGIRVAVFGDLLVDEFIYGRISRVSREAPVLILEYDSTEIVPGGAGNAANNVAALGGIAIAIGVTGQDEAGRRLVETMRDRIDVRNVVSHASLLTPTKTRILAGGVHSAKQQVVRVDRAARVALPDVVRTAVARRLIATLSRCDALLVSDYGTGLVTSSVVASAQKKLRGPGR